MKKRIFISVNLSDEARSKVFDYIENLRKEFIDLKVRWDKPEKLHITLKFLGDIEVEKISEIVEVVEKVAKRFSKFKLKITESGIFPTVKKPRILWFGLFDEKGSLKKINDGLESELERIGFAKDKRNFKPHLTIVRLREPQKSGELVKKHLENKFEPVEFEVSEIVIYESKLQSTGSIYILVRKILFN
jgi:2'-5' RNA ligase